MLETICHKKIFEGIRANDALNKLCDEKFYCLVYSPDFCGFLTPDKVLNLNNVFEIRCFNENFELRWSKNAQETGNAVIISEEQKFRGFDMEAAGNFYKRSSRYLLWGTSREINGKIYLCDYRIGEIEIPLKIENGKKVFLTFDEFFSAEPKHGNIIWSFERLTGFQTGD